MTMKVPFDYSGKSVFVAGGTSGINLGVAQRFAEAGAKVGVLSRSQSKVDEAVKALQSHGTRVVGYAADVRDPAAVEQALRAAHTAIGEFDVLVSGAAGNFPAPALGLSPNGFKAVVDIDLLGSFHVLRAAYPLMRKPGGSIINISAPQAWIPMELQMHVCAAKAGVDMVTRVAAMEWGPVGLRVNSVSPGPIEGTEGLRRLAPSPEAISAVLKTVPLGTLGTTTDIADTCLWLGSPYARYVSGCVIPVDGGWSIAGVSVTGSMLKQALSAPPKG
jgi:NAD(P)-dependent dehydrogenase (short-subunit alcohol dehydrogenase family)